MTIRRKWQSVPATSLRGVKRILGILAIMTILLLLVWWCPAASDFLPASLMDGKFKSTAYLNTAAHGGGGEAMVVYDWNTPDVNPQWLQPVDVKRHVKQRLNVTYPIDVVHRQGWYHSGAWMLLVDANRQVLALQRGPQLVTCPNAWSLLGEHSQPTMDPVTKLVRDETPLQNVQRGLLEEVGEAVLQKVAFFRRLTPHPLLYLRDYGAPRQHRYDRQMTHVWWIQLAVPASQITLALDSEVAQYQWMPLQELQHWVQSALPVGADIYQHAEKYADEDMQQEALAQKEGWCHSTIVKLCLWSLQELQRALQLAQQPPDLTHYHHAGAGHSDAPQ